jgi:hypothetical protein
VFQINGKSILQKKTKFGKRMGEKEGMYIISAYYGKMKE